MNMNHWSNEQFMMMPHIMGPNMGMGHSAPGPSMGHMTPGSNMGHMTPGSNMGHIAPGPNIGHIAPGPNMGHMTPRPNMGPIAPGPNMAPPALLPTPMQPPVPVPDGMVPPLAPPSFMLNDWNSGNNPVGPDARNIDFIGPKKPVDLTIDDNKEENEHHAKNSRERDTRDSRRDTGDQDRDRNRRPRSPYNRRDNRDRNDRSRNDRRERRTQRWSDNNDTTPGTEGQMPMGTSIIPGTNMIQYGNTVMMSQQQMDMHNMTNMMPNMSNMMPNMPNMNMMSNMMPGMMNMGIDQNMVIMQMSVNNNQPICLSCGILLPPVPNAQLQSRRERPPGCRTIFVGGLPHFMTEDAIREIFERFGVVSDVKIHKQGVCHVRFGSQELVEQSFFISGFRFKRHDQVDNEATTIFIDYALNREDQCEYERKKRRRTPTPARVEPYSPAAFAALAEKIKSDAEFGDAAPSLAGWLERGECNKKNANAFYSLIQASNNQIRRLYSEKMAIDEEFQNIKAAMRDKFAAVITQFELVGKILTAAKMQRVSDHFTKQQRRNIEMWLKMTEDVENIKEEFNALFDEEESEDKTGKAAVIMKKYDELKVEYENLQYEVEGYRNEAHLAKDEAERKLEKFKAHFIAQQALQNNQPGHHQHQVFPPLPPPPPIPTEPPLPGSKPTPPPQLVSTSEAKLISILTAFLLVHPLGASLDYLVSYVRSIIPTVSQSMVLNTLQKYGDVFAKQMTGVGANIETKWTFVTYDVIKKEVV